MTLTTAKWTIDPYQRTIEAGILNDCKVELLNGVIVEKVSEGTAHTYFSDRFANRLRVALFARAQIREARSITLPNNSEPEPDIAVVQSLKDILEHHPYPEYIILPVSCHSS